MSLEGLIHPAFGAALVALARVADVSLDTFRLALIARGKSLLPAAVGFTEAVLYIAVVAVVLKNDLQWPHVVGYGLGFALGTLIGLSAARRFGHGRVLMKIFSPVHGMQIAETLRDAGFAVTVLNGQGRDGVVPVLMSVIDENRGADLRDLVRSIDPDAFLVGEVVSYADGGFVHVARPTAGPGGLARPRIRA